MALPTLLIDESLERVLVTTVNPATRRGAVLASQKISANPAGHLALDENARDAGPQYLRMPARQRPAEARRPFSPVIETSGA
jgi:hypothetical protein